MVACAGSSVLQHQNIKTRTQYEKYVIQSNTTLVISFCLKTYFNYNITRAVFDCITYFSYCIVDTTGMHRLKITFKKLIPRLNKYLDKCSDYAEN
jgi:hypothetical protein